MLWGRRDDGVLGIDHSRVGGDRDAVIVLGDLANPGVQHNLVADLCSEALGDLLRGFGDAVLLLSVFDGEHVVEPAYCLDVAQHVQQRHVERAAAPLHPGDDVHQRISAGDSLLLAEPFAERDRVELVGVRRLPRGIDIDSLQQLTHLDGDSP
ncbi:Uncharacterised protein [Mycobacteroides abscessus subsp. abscessus]|nr:Uncharacterised protein [Mycobacteroides abscessus subsp. abscessus]SKY59945.1 Uncharacterised protein [Mycobacteroides abscessus subsp. abscessus]